MAEDQAAHDGDAERAAEFCADSVAEREGKSAEKRGGGGHHDRAEAEEAGLKDGVDRRFAFFSFGFEGEVDHHDGVFLDDADEQDQADQGDDAEIGAADEERQECADAGGGERGEDRDGVDVAFVKNAQNDVDGDESGENQNQFVGEGCFEGGGGSLESGLDAGGHVEAFLRRGDFIDGGAE